MSKDSKLKMSISRKGLLSGNKNPMYGRHEDNPMYGKYGKNHPSSKPVYQYSLDGIFIKKWDSMTEAVISLGKTQSAVTYISACYRGKIRTALGYIWRREFDTKMAFEREKLKVQKDKQEEDARLKEKQITKKPVSNK